MEEFCKNGNHNLTVIHSYYNDPLSENVIRWCKNCGAIVVDVDYDGRTNPGYVMKMKFPKIMYALIKNKKKK